VARFRPHSVRGLPDKFSGLVDIARFRVVALSHGDTRKTVLETVGTGSVSSENKRPPESIDYLKSLRLRRSLEIAAVTVKGWLIVRRQRNQIILG